MKIGIKNWARNKKWAYNIPWSRDVRCVKYLGNSVIFNLSGNSYAVPATVGSVCQNVVLLHFLAGMYSVLETYTNCFVIFYLSINPVSFEKRLFFQPNLVRLCLDLEVRDLPYLRL